MILEDSECHHFFMNAVFPIITTSLQHHYDIAKAVRKAVCKGRQAVYRLSLLFTNNTNKIQVQVIRRPQCPQSLGFTAVDSVVAIMSRLVIVIPVMRVILVIVETYRIYKPCMFVNRGVLQNGKFARTFATGLAKICLNYGTHFVFCTFS